MISVPAFLPCGNLILQHIFVGSRCATVTLGVPPNRRIFSMIWDYPFGSLFVHGISNVLMSIVITYITIGVSKTTLNGVVQLFYHLLWVMFPLLRPLLTVKYVVPHMYTLLCVMLK